MKLGGLLEMFKQYKINLKRNKKKNIKKIFYSTCFIFAYPFFFFLKQFKQDKKGYLPSKKEYSYIYQKLAEIKSLNIFEEKVINQKIKEVSKDIKEIVDLKTRFHLVEEVRNTQKQLKEKSKKIAKEKKDILEDIVVSKKVTKELFMKKLGLKETNEKLDKIIAKIPNSHYNDLYDLERSLKELEEKVILLKKECEKFGLSQDFKIEGLTIYEINEKMKKIKKQIALKKDEIYFKKETKVEEIKQKKELPKEEKKEVIKKIVSKKLIVQKIILDNIQLQKTIIKQSNNNPTTLFASLRNITRNIFLVIFPFSLFKNKLFNTLVGNVMLNNSLKSMNKMIDKSYVANYELLEEEYYSKKSMLLEIDRLSTNSLNEIANLKENIFGLYKQNLNNLELKKFINDLDQIEDRIYNSQNKLNIVKNNINIEYNKTKQKVKEW